MYSKYKRYDIKRYHFNLMGDCKNHKGNRKLWFCTLCNDEEPNCSDCLCEHIQKKHPDIKLAHISQKIPEVVKSKEDLLSKSKDQLELLEAYRKKAKDLLEIYRREKSKAEDYEQDIQGQLSDKKEGILKFQIEADSLYEDFLMQITANSRLFEMNAQLLDTKGRIEDFSNKQKYTEAWEEVKLLLKEPRVEKIPELIDYKLSLLESKLSTFTEKCLDLNCRLVTKNEIERKEKEFKSLQEEYQKREEEISIFT